MSRVACERLTEREVIADGIASAMVLGCAGSVWMVAMLCLLVAFAAVRR